MAYFFSFQTRSENYCFCYQRELAQNIAHRQLPLQRKPVSGSVGSSYSVVWLRVKPVGALVMENRCGNGLVLLLYPPAASLAVMKNNGFIPEGRRPQVTPSPFPPHNTTLFFLLLLLHMTPPVCSDRAGEPTDDWAGSHLASVHLV